MHAFYHVFTIIIGITGTGVEGATTSVPVNTLVVVGETARINCSTDLNQPVCWTRTLTGSDAEQWLFYGIQGFNGNDTDGRFSIAKNEVTGRYDLIITDVQQKDAGQYACIDESGLGARASAELVVSDPIKCKSRIPSDGVMGYNIFGIEQDLIQVSCSLTYTGNLSPTLEWSWPGSGVQNDERDASPTTSFVTSAIKLSPTIELNNVKFKCKANIAGETQHKIDRGLLSWESETVNVRYTEFGSDEVDMCPGVKWNLHCNPPCSYHFERVDDECQCLYTYYDTRTQQKYEVTSDAIRCGKDSDILLAFYVAVAVVIDLSATVIIIIVLACYSTNWTKRRSSDDSTEYGQDNKDDKSKDNIEMLETI